MTMKKNKPYQFMQKGLFYVLLLQFVFFSGCGQTSKNSGQDHLLSMIITWDSVTVYHGDLGKNTPYKRIALEEKNIKAFFEQEKDDAETELTLLLKLSLENAGNGFMNQIGDVIRWGKQSGINNIELVDLTETDQAVFKLRASPWAWLDSLTAPSTLDLNMPREDKYEVEPDPAPGSVTVLLIKDDEWFCYSDTAVKNGKFYSREECRLLFAEKKKQFGDKFLVIIKPAKKTPYRVTVDALDEMTINKIDRYAMTHLNDAEKSFLNFTDEPPTRTRRKLTVEDFLFMPPEPVEITTPGSVSTSALPHNNAFLIELKADNTVQYQVLMHAAGQTWIEVKKPITENLGKAIADFEKKYPGMVKQYLIKGHPNAKYPLFEQVINALKQNNQFKYNLVTSTDE
jgi:biopolymer transport protein ExbD